MISTYAAAITVLFAVIFLALNLVEYRDNEGGNLTRRFFLAALLTVIIVGLARHIS